MNLHIRNLVQCWRERVMHDGFTPANTVIEAVHATGGYLPSFIDRQGVRWVVKPCVPAPTATAANNTLRDVLWGAHVDGRICLHQSPTAQERAA